MNIEMNFGKNTHEHGWDDLANEIKRLRGCLRQINKIASGDGRPVNESPAVRMFEAGNVASQALKESFIPR